MISFGQWAPLKLMEQIRTIRDDAKQTGKGQHLVEPLWRVHRTHDHGMAIPHGVPKKIGQHEPPGQIEQTRRKTPNSGEGDKRNPFAQCQSDLRRLRKSPQIVGEGLSAGLDKDTREVVDIETAYETSQRAFHDDSIFFDI